MRVLIFLLLIAVIKIQARLPAEACFLYYAPYCGFAEGCVVNAGNKCHLEGQEKIRVKANKPPFIKMEPGRCPEDIPLCEYIIFGHSFRARYVFAFCLFHTTMGTLTTFSGQNPYFKSS
ncbi:accessory gland protein Acp63F-like isoform X1 [Drosophila obscura]|uniref:accessory gland protein Acp63F-like isoform X1 n=1 Tax=Drosophila obscura TaxID=7282 RepID=UPI001BB1B703|nr:accessory gland protein Acp63F-like isoform X1 [Drosophila obscura]